MIEYLLLFGLVGVGAGILGGLLGMSGGLITVPSLLFIFDAMGFPPEYRMHIAVGTSLASMILNSLSSTIAHSQSEGVIWKLIQKLFPGIILGSLFGALFARTLSSTMLQIVFGVCIILLALYMLFSRLKPPKQTHSIPPGPFITLLGFLIAALSNVLGIGGGIIVVPTLLALRVQLRRAIGTAAAFGLITTTVGALSYLSLDYRIDTVPYSLGYLYIPAFIMLSIASFITAPFGARLTHLLPTPLLRRLFALALLITGICLLFQ